MPDDEREPTNENPTAGNRELERAEGQPTPPAGMAPEGPAPAGPAPDAGSPGPVPGYAWGGWAPPGSSGPPSGYPWGGWPAGPPPAQAGARPRGLARLLASAVTAWIVAGALALAVVGLSVALATGGSGRDGAPARFGGGGPEPGARLGGPGPLGGAGPLRGAGPLGGTFRQSGVAGTVTSVASGSFTVNDRSGQAVTVREQSSTKYYAGTSSASAGAVVTGARVLVEGSRSGNTVTASRVEVLPAGFPGFAQPR